MESILIRFIMITLMLTFSIFGFSIIRYVSQDGSTPYTTIQSAIDVTTDSDTIIVNPGRYVENVVIRNRDLMLASLELTTSNRDYIDTTIIDGNHTDCSIIIKDRSTVEIRGFSITNGLGHHLQDDFLNGGGGIECESVLPVTITNCSIFGNKASNGGGIFIYSASVLLQGNRIFNNLATGFGGGICGFGNLDTDNPIIFNEQNKCSIYNNHASSAQDCEFGAFENVHVVLDTCTVINAYPYFIDGFTYYYPLTAVTYEIEHAFMQEIDHDFYVSPNGDDANDGLTAATSLHSIAAAMYRIAADSLNPKTVHLAPGTYTVSAGNLSYETPVKSWTHLSGNSTEDTILDGESAYELLYSTSNQHIEISNLTCRNPRGSGIDLAKNNHAFLHDLIFENGFHDDEAGINIYQSSNTRIQNTKVRNNLLDTYNCGYVFSECSGANFLLNCTLENNTYIIGSEMTFVGNASLVMDGCSFSGNQTIDNSTSCIFRIGALQSSDSLDVIIRNSNFCDNTQLLYHSMSEIYHVAHIEISNCTFANNMGGNTVLTIDGNSVLSNNIFWNPYGPQEILIPYHPYPDVGFQESFANNLIRGGQGGVLWDTSDEVIWLEGNISNEPEFFGWGNFPYMISSTSPGVDAGTSHLPCLRPMKSDLYRNPRIAGSYSNRPAIDIGSYEYQGQIHANFTASIEEGTVPLTVHFTNLTSGDYRQCQWDFNGDGVLDSEEINPTYVFETGGTYSPSLIVSNINIYDSIRKHDLVVVEPVGNEDHTGIPVESLSIYPNPFHGNTKLSLNLNTRQKIRIEIFNIRGQRVKTLVDAQYDTGKYAIAWNGTDKYNKSLSSGIYFCTTTMGKKTITKKIVLVK